LSGPGGDVLELSLNANSVAAVAQALLSATMALMLRAGARTPSRKTLALAQMWLAAYGVSVFGTFSLDDARTGNTVNVAALLFGMFATLALLRYASWLERGARPQDPTPASARIQLLATLLGCAGGAVGVYGAWAPDRTLVRAGSIAINLVILALFVTLFVVLRSAYRRGVAAARSMARACAWPVVAIVANIAMSALAMIPGVELPVALYGLVRDMSLLLFTFGLLVAYLDHGHEPMSLHARLIAGTLTIVAGFLTTAAHVLEPWIMSVVPAGASDAARSGAALRLLGLLVGGGALVYALLPRLYRRNVLEPLDALVGAIVVVEKGETASLPVEREDELGRLSRSFNAMSRGLAEGRRTLEEKVRQLEARQKEVEQLNEELRHQIASRSKSIAETLGHSISAVTTHVAGAIIGGRYRLERVLGQGGMGVVYEAIRSSDDRRFALKMLSDNASQVDALRLAREAEIAAKLSHPNLVGVADVGIEDGRVYLVMDLVRGGSLEEARSRFGDASFALPVLLQVARGLVALHDATVVHRDLKPSNVLLEELDGSRVAKIADFGIARLDPIDVLAATSDVNAPTARAAALTQTGIMLGTLAYMAPELAKGSTAVRPPVDVFAFGVMAFEVLTGRYPFRLPPMLAILGSVSQPKPEPVPDVVPEPVRRMVERALAFEPSLRPAASELVATLEAATISRD
jgi:HAMP domain-containing protein